MHLTFRKLFVRMLVVECYEFFKSLDGRLGVKGKEICDLLLKLVFCKNCKFKLADRFGRNARMRSPMLAGPFGSLNRSENCTSTTGLTTRAPAAAILRQASAISEPYIYISETCTHSLTRMQTY